MTVRLARAILSGMTKSRSGFTLVEIMAVIVIIAILATVTLVTYNGVTTRARTTQTVSAAEQWVKAILVYRARNGALPPNSTCLGSSYNYNYDNLGVSGVGQCRQSGASFGIVSDSTTLTSLATYITGNPTPAMITAYNSSTSWYRGLYFYRNGTDQNGYLTFVVEGGASSCPSALSNITLTSSDTQTNGNTACAYSLGSYSGYS